MEDDLLKSGIRKLFFRKPAHRPQAIGDSHAVRDGHKLPNE